MHALVLPEACIRCGMCPSICPEVFTLPDNGEAAHTIADPIPDNCRAAAQDAADNCPTSAIQIS